MVYEGGTEVVTNPNDTCWTGGPIVQPGAVPPLAPAAWDRERVVPAVSGGSGECCQRIAVSAVVHERLASSSGRKSAPSAPSARLGARPR
jgi:hypothetical protein